MEIRKLEKRDIEEVVEFWCEVSIKAHDFIPSNYWKENKEAMATVYLPESETYVAIEGNVVAGFVAMADNYLAAIFVKGSMQGQGIGKQLLDYIKDKRETIHLKVYKKNVDSINFYKKQGFKLLYEEMEEVTGEFELVMEWKKGN